MDDVQYLMLLATIWGANNKWFPAIICFAFSIFYPEL